MDYNTSRTKLLLPEYGRLVQEMVAEALQMENREGRQAYAQVIIRVMESLKPNEQHIQDYEHKLWEHLAFMADYRLDIDYPYEISQEAMFQKPAAVPYPKESVRFRHYGHITEKWIREIAAMPEGTEREQLTLAIANYMKRSFVERRGGHIADEKIAHDLETYTNGELRLDTSVHRLVNVASAPLGKKR